VRLATAGVPQAGWDAELLLRHALGWDRARLAVGLGESLASEVAARYQALVEQRARRRPLQHLTGTQAFWRLELRVTPDVLIPRPETELIVAASLELLRGVARPLIVDVGTGSGCIALALAAERPDAEVHASDLSEPALAVARDNAHRLGLAERVTFHHGHLLEPVATLAGRIDLVASNPPYVERTEELAPEVRDHEPGLALFPPGDRYSVYRELLPAAQRVLRPGGWLVVEVGLGMADEVTRLCASSELGVERVIEDLQQIPRTVVARAAGEAEPASPHTTKG
jgi:release factor glutamine methyltransferase